ncbi:MAG: hypothetical protein IPN92_06985 [Chromatiaceae bacterium]|nr:hypothetical protein [Chromatiaceae bacterium]
MTQVRIPAPSSQYSALAPTTVSVRLVTADGRPVLGWSGSRLVAECADLPLDTDRLLTLVPQSAIALATGAATWYAITIKTRVRSEDYLVQVPDTAVVVDLADLVAAELIPPAELLAELLVPYLEARDAAVAAAAETAALLTATQERLLPDPATLPDGAMVQVINGQWVLL